MFVVCPGCGHTFPITESKGESRLHCEKCKTSFFVQMEPDPPPPPAEQTNSYPEAKPIEAPRGPVQRTVMPATQATIRCSCPRCQKPLEAPLNWAGQKMSCPSCGQRLQIPAAPVAAGPPLNKTVLADPQPMAPAPGPTPAPRPAPMPAPAPHDYRPAPSAPSAAPRPVNMTQPAWGPQPAFAPPRRGKLGLILGLVIGGVLLIGLVLVILFVFVLGGGGSNVLVGKWDGPVQIEFTSSRVTVTGKDDVVTGSYRIIDASTAEVTFDGSLITAMEREVGGPLDPEERERALAPKRVSYRLEGDELVLGFPGRGDERYRRVR